MERTMRLAMVLSASDKASKVIAGFANKTMADLAKLEQRLKLTGSGVTDALVNAGVAAGAQQMLAAPIAAFAQLEDAAAGLRSVMMNDAGSVNEAMFGRVAELAEDLGNKLPGNTADFYNMFSTMIKGGKNAEQIMGGLGKATAYLAVALKLPYEEAAKISAKLSEATGVADADMLAFLDTINRTTKLGVEAGEMQYAFGKSAGALKLLGIQGLEASKSLAPLYAQLIRTGASGETVGTNMSAVFNALADQSKVGKLNAALKGYGKQMQFFRDGKFLGIQNLIVQMSQLKDMTVEQRAAIMSAFVGPGQDAAFLQTIISNGVDGYNDVANQMLGMATLEQEVGVKLGTLASKYESLGGTWKNTLAAMGSTVAPELKELVDLLAGAAVAVGNFVKQNPAITKVALGLVAVVGGAAATLATIGAMSGAMAAVIGLVVKGAAVFKLLSSVMGIAKVATLRFGAALWTNPIVWIIGGIVALGVAIGALVYYWDDVTAAMGRAWDWLKGIGAQLLEAGKQIPAMIAQGITAAAFLPVKAMMAIVQKVRDLLPFSPAKAGPLRDIHRVKLVETIAGAIKPQPMMDAMQGAVGSLAAAPMPGAGGGAGGGGTLVFSPTININGAGPGAAQSLRDQVEALLPELARRLEDMQRRASRTSFTQSPAF